MLAELKRLFNKEFSHQLTVCVCCQRKINFIMIDGIKDITCYTTCEECKKSILLS